MHPAAVVAVLLGIAGVVLLVVGGRRVGSARGVDRVRLPAREISRRSLPNGHLVEVEYPAPDGSPMRAEMFVWWVRAPGVAPTFDGTVWANRADPRDVTPRRQGRSAGGVVLLVVGGVLLLLAFGLGVTALVLSVSSSFPTAP